MRFEREYKNSLSLCSIRRSKTMRKNFFLASIMHLCTLSLLFTFVKVVLDFSTFILHCKTSGSILKFDNSVCPILLLWAFFPKLRSFYSNHKTRFRFFYSVEKKRIWMTKAVSFNIHWKYVFLNNGYQTQESNHKCWWQQALNRTLIKELFDNEVYKNEKCFCRLPYVYFYTIFKTPIS